MRKSHIAMFGLCILLVFTASFPSVRSDASSLENDLVLDFSQTQFSFIDPMESWFIFKFGATNIGTKTLMVHFEQYCVEYPLHLPTQAPQGDALLAPGESTWFKLVFQSGSFGI
ncbi:MAG: hypothetical protein QW674_04650 [Candidatus Bathyarchaeia archaeon]